MLNFQGRAEQGAFTVLFGVSAFVIKRNPLLVKLITA